MSRVSRPMIYAIDFDGTIVEHRYPYIGELNKEAQQFILDLQERGDQWILYTMREGDKLMEAVEYCRERGMFPTAVNDNTEELKREFNNNPRKIYADYYIDDHNLGGLRWK